MNTTKTVVESLVILFSVKIAYDWHIGIAGKENPQLLGEKIKSIIKKIKLSTPMVPLIVLVRVLGGLGHVHHQPHHQHDQPYKEYQ